MGRVWFATLCCAASVFIAPVSEAETSRVNIHIQMAGLETDFHAQNYSPRAQSHKIVACTSEGNVCESDSDCCGGLSCAGGSAAGGRACLSYDNKDKLNRKQ